MNGKNTIDINMSPFVLSAVQGGSSATSWGTLKKAGAGKKTSMRFA